jgi:hypothetical protein
MITEINEYGLSEIDISCPLCQTNLQSYERRVWWCPNRSCRSGVFRSSVLSNFAIAYNSDHNLWSLKGVEYSFEKLERLLKLKAFW